MNATHSTTGTRRLQPAKFLSAKYTTARHIDLSHADRATLHQLLTALHRAIHRGRHDVATVLAEWAARLCQQTNQEEARGWQRP